MKMKSAIWCSFLFAVTCGPAWAAGFNSPIPRGGAPGGAGTMRQQLQLQGQRRQERAEAERRSQIHEANVRGVEESKALEQAYQEAQAAGQKAKWDAAVAKIQDEAKAAFEKLDGEYLPIIGDLESRAAALEESKDTEAQKQLHPIKQKLSEVQGDYDQRRAKITEERDAKIKDVPKAVAAAAKKATQDKVLKWHLEQAEKGDSFGLFRMGEHYRDGDGVLRDLDKAREYFTKAVAAGSPAAAEALSKLNQPLTNSSASH